MPDPQTPANATQEAAVTTAVVPENAAEAQQVASAFGVTVPQTEEVAEQHEEQVTTEQVEGQETVATEPVEGSIEHKLQSWVGRKLAESNRNTEATIRNILAEFIPQQQRQQEAPVIPEPHIPEGIDPNGIVTTYGEVFQAVEARERARVTNEQRYWGGYVKTLDTLGNQYELNPDQTKEMIAMISAENQKTNADPSVAANINFHKAYVKLLKQNGTAKATPQVPVSGKPPISATGVATTQKTETAQTETFAADSDVRKIMNAFNLSEDKAKEIHKEISKGV